MAYKALYRKYRPDSFAEVAGQKHIVQTLKNAIEDNKIAHAYLFCGPRGTGKTSIAKIFAKTINCTSDHKPCMECDNCKAMAAGNHPDVIEIDAASNNGVEEVRNLIDQVKYAPLKGKYKVYIIDEVHMMSTGAFNALLKTIEEPPAHVIFILATTEPYKILPTIISRCQRFDFNKVPQSEIIRRINTVLASENITASDKVVKLIAQLADGGLRDALSILDKCIAYAQNNIEEHHINEIYGIVSVEEKVNTLQQIMAKDAYNLMNSCDDWIEKGIDIPRLTADLIDIIKETLIYEITSEEKLLNVLDVEQAKTLISQSTKQHRYQMVDVLMKAYDKYRFASSVGAYFQVCLLEMMDEPENNVVRVNPSPTVEKVQVKSPKIKEVVDVVEDDIIDSSIPDVNNVQNVSHETFNKPSDNVPRETLSLDKNQNEKKNSGMKPLENEFVLRLLVGANKPEKANDQSKWGLINDYLLDFDYARYASILKSVTIVASSESYLLVSTSNQVVANEINELDKNEMFITFINKLLNKNKKIFAITTQHSEEVIQEFRVRMMNKTLPPKIEFNIKVDDKVVEEQTSEQLVVGLFGEENVLITEE